MKIKEVLVIVVLSCIISITFGQSRVVLDNYYNNEIDTKIGKPFHYLWADTAMSGFSQLAELFIQKGAIISTMKEKPTNKNLKKVKIYIIVDPDTKLETVNPNYMDDIAAKSIENWVKEGGVLLILTNDSKNSELERFNILAERFGMHFVNELLHPEKSEYGQPRNFDSCASINLPNHPLFDGVSKIFLKEIAPIKCVGPAKPVLKENNKIIMAEARVGKGFVFAVGDPWLYNEYIDHWVLPKEFDNLKTAKNLVELLIMKSRSHQ